MLEKKKIQNKLLLAFASLLSIITIVIYVAHQHLGWLETTIITTNGQLMQHDTKIVVLVLIALLLIMIMASIVMYRQQATASLLPLVISLTLTLASITIIAAGNGLMEYHFSIFVVMALITMFNSKALVLVNATIFAFQHFGGYFLFPEILCGSVNYQFSNLLIHAFFLVFITMSSIVIISQMQQSEQKQQSLELENRSLQQKVIFHEIVGNEKLMDEETNAITSIIDETVMVVQGMNTIFTSLLQSNEKLQVLVDNSLVTSTHQTKQIDELMDVASLLNNVVEQLNAIVKYQSFH